MSGVVVTSKSLSPVDVLPRPLYGVDTIVRNPAAVPAEADRTLKPVGYNAKIIETSGVWLGNAAVEEILSVSECISKSPIDHAALWLCNCWLLYNTPDDLDAALARTDVDEPNTLRRFYYEAYPEAVLAGEWRALEEIPTGAVRPARGFILRGHDVVCFSTGVSPECSPLSCNSGAKYYEVNRHCLLNTLDEALGIARLVDLEGGYEPGPYGIVSVYEQAVDKGVQGRATSAHR